MLFGLSFCEKFSVCLGFVITNSIKRCSISRLLPQHISWCASFVCSSLWFRCLFVRSICSQNFAYVVYTANNCIPSVPKWKYQKNLNTYSTNLCTQIWFDNKTAISQNNGTQTLPQTEMNSSYCLLSIPRSKPITNNGNPWLKCCNFLSSMRFGRPFTALRLFFILNYDHVLKVFENSLTRICCTHYEMLRISYYIDHSRWNHTILHTISNFRNEIRYTF